MNTIKNPITGRDKLVIQDDGVYDAITGAKVGIIENGVVKSVYTGAAWAVVVQGEGGDSIDLSFITATAGDILSGKVGADASGNPVVGSISMRESMTLTPGTSWKSIPAGTYLAGDQYIAGDENLIPENIADGVSIFNVQGTHKGGMDFFKCASVDTSAKTWSGYKAVLTDGVYSFEENVTAGLTYTVITPATGKIYTADALCEIKKLYNGIPVDGLVFYAPFSEAKTTAETGQSIGSGGQYKVVKGIPCLWLDYDRVDVGMDNFPTGGETYTASMWMCADYEQGYSEPVYAFIWGRDASGCNANFRYDPQTGYAYIAGGYDNQITSNDPVAGKWSHLLFTFDKGTFTAYQDGKLIGTSVNPNFDIGTAGARIGISLGGGHYYRGGVAAIRIYDRVLTNDEITKLSEEFTEHLNPVFYASLSKASSAAETGQALIARNVTYETVDGIPCAYFDGNATIYMPDNDENILRLPRYKMPGTISLWFKSTAAKYASIMNYCGENRTSRGIWLTDNGNITLNDGFDNLSDTFGFCDDVNHFNGNWCHALITYNGTTLKLYIDGIEKSSVDYELNTGAMRFGIGAWAWEHITHYFTGYVAAVRVYDRVVTAEEIKQLAGEFDI